jgi:outer membrane protein TolC
LASKPISLAPDLGAVSLKEPVRIKGTPLTRDSSLLREAVGRGKLCLLLGTLACAVWLAGCTAAHYRRSADKETYRAIAGKSSLVTNMDPHFTIEQTNTVDLTGLPVVAETNDFLGEAAAAEVGARILSLQQALELAVKSSRSYQDNKELLYLTALSLTLARHQFAPIFSGGGSTTYSVDRSDGLVEKFDAAGNAGVGWLLRDIGKITASFTTDFLRYLSGDPNTITSSQIGATFTRPLLRNAGYKAEIETLTQAERDLLYQLRNFARFRKDFSVLIASAYYGVLGNRDAVRNSFLNLAGSRRAGDRTRALAAEGLTTQTDLGRIEQQELSAESAWVNAGLNYQRSLDDFKIQLGISVETRMVLDDRELQALKIQNPKIKVADAIAVALAARLDYQNVRDQLKDSDRRVALAADALKPQLDFVANGAFINPTNSGFAWPDPKRYNWSAGATVDLPFDRKLERNSYRAALISRESSARAADLQRDQIELQVRDSWRTLEQARRNYEISEVGVKLAERRVEEQELLAEVGRAKALDQVDAQNALVSSKDQRTQALVAHTIARLQFWDNMGILYIKENGQWQELDEKGIGASKSGADTSPALAGPAGPATDFTQAEKSELSATHPRHDYENPNTR